MHTSNNNSFQGAGGVGGLLASTRFNANSQLSTIHFYHYDGNGNVTELTDNSGSVVASYRYTAFGKLRSISGPAAEENTYRFSTKPYDSVSQCYYYGYRFYNPEMGRWLNRDPIGERGGVNLYAFVGNDVVNSYDVLGNVPSWQSCEEPEVWTSNPDGETPDADGCSAPRILPGVPDNPGWWLDADFESACNDHDLCYSDCDKSRLDCDQTFREAMLSACNNRYSWWNPQRARCRKWAQTYYRGVRMFAGLNRAYRDRQEAACHCACPES